MVVPISIEKFVAKYMKSNPSADKKLVLSSLKNSVKSKKSDARCIHCGQPIWAIGSSFVGWDGCFTCITGDSDDSQDYEIDEVC
ncbi:hypothetical protein EDD64_106101 [Effusibacillus lacus]|nr:hypothetical protein EDD64_106101 [Effusibacillus lacus]